MSDEASQKHGFSVREVIDTFLCNRSLWNTFGLFWLFLPLMMVFLTVSLFLTPAHYYVLFPVLCTLPVVSFMMYKKRQPDFFKSSHHEIFDNGTLSQKIGALLFISIFFGMFGWGLAMLALLSIYQHLTGSSAFGVTPRTAPVFLWYGLQCGVFMAAYIWVFSVISAKLSRPKP